jgi:hypothetical protein
MKLRGPQKRMKRLLRDKTRKAFFKNGEWTKDPDIATDFRDMDDVLEICELYGVNDAEIVVHFSSGPDIAVPVS